MYQTARMADITLSRNALAVCITRLAMRPAKSFWKNDQFWRTTCQWLCQRIRLVAPGISAFWRIAMSASSTSGRTMSISTTMPSSIGDCCASAAWRSAASISETSLPMNTGITVSISATARLVANMSRIPALGLAHEVPVEGEQAGRRRPRSGVPLAVPRMRD